ncbi:hypothetical protein [Massilia sp. LC238]|uniref:hypothetical protein n=1 Tax=Massilia sp. LC238 TaxID=1502852 RepID=UPI0009DF4180|nr:hypothetical protein [Massilia sp. LC238]
MKRSYEISPRPQDLGGGWNLKLYEDDQEAVGGVFPIPADGPHEGMFWRKSLSEEPRAHWLMMAASAMPAAARHAFLTSEAYNDALDEGESWTSL